MRSITGVINRRSGAREARGDREQPSYFTLHLIENQSSAQSFPKSIAHYIAARLLTLKAMGLAETTDGNSWRVRCDFEMILRAMQRANDRQKMLAAHGALLSDERLQLVAEDLRQLELLEGRVVLHGEEEAGIDPGRFYLLLEGTDGRLHHVYYTREIHYARSIGKLRTNAFIRLRRVSIEGGPQTLEVEDFGDAERLLQNVRYFLDTLQDRNRQGIATAQDGWAGWLGRYQSKLVHFAQQTQRQPARRIQIEPTGGFRGRG